MKTKNVVFLLFFYCIFYCLTRSFMIVQFGQISTYLFIGIMLAFVAFYFITYKSQKIKLKKNYFCLMYFVFIMYVIINMLIASNSSTYALFEYVFYLLFFLAVNFVLYFIDIDKILYIFEVVGVILAIEAIWEYLTGNILYRTIENVQTITRAYGLIGSPLTLGTAFACIGLISLYLGKIKSKKHYIITILILLGLLATQSRGPLVGFVIGFISMLVIEGMGNKGMKAQKLLKNIIKIVLIFLIILAILNMFKDKNEIINIIYDRIISIFEWGEDRN